MIASWGWDLPEGYHWKEKNIEWESYLLVT